MAPGEPWGWRGPSEPSRDYLRCRAADSGTVLRPLMGQFSEDNRDETGLAACEGSHISGSGWIYPAADMG